MMERPENSVTVVDLIYRKEVKRDMKANDNKKKRIGMCGKSVVEYF